MLGMVLVTFFTFLSSLLTYTLLLRVRLLPKTLLFSVVVAWFAAQVVSAFAIMLLSLVLAPLTSGVLLKASVLYALLVGGALVGMRREVVDAGRHALARHTRLDLLALAVLTGLILPFTYRFYTSHLTYDGAAIWTSIAYWDLNVHAPIIQTFVHGDNFPPQNESFAGLPITYHYFFDFLTSIYAALGLELIGAINYVSIVALSMLLLGIVGFCQEYLDSRWVGVLAALLTLTTSSLRFFADFERLRGIPFVSAVQLIVTNYENPFLVSFLEGNPYGYNGTMFNLFYFLAERQLVLASLYFLVACHLMLVGRQTTRRSFLIGAALALFFQWHIFVTIAVGAALGLLALPRLIQRRLDWMLVGFALVFLVQVVYFKLLSTNEWFLPTVNNYPTLNFEFASFPPYFPASLPNAILYYIYAYGFKPVVFLVGCYVLRRERRPVLLPLLAIIVPTFILINTVQLSPLSVYDNHKWLRPMNVLVDIVAAYAVYRVFFASPRWLLRGAGVLVASLLMLGGLIELFPFLNTQPTRIYGLYPTEFIHTIRATTHPQAVFVSAHSKELHLAGRRLFLDNPEDEPGAASAVVVAQLDTARRRGVMAAIYLSQDVATLCALVQAHGIDYLEVASVASFPPLSQGVAFPRIEVRDERGLTTTFVHVAPGCTARQGQ
jgi:hypothetical protein